MKKYIFRSPVSKGEASKTRYYCVFPLELVGSNDHHKLHNIKPSFNNYSISVAGRCNSLTLQVSRFFKHSSGEQIYKQTINFFLTSITEKTGLKYNNLMLFFVCMYAMYRINVNQRS